MLDFFPSSVTSEICLSLVVGGTDIPVRTDVSPRGGGARRLPLVTRTQTLFFCLFVYCDTTAPSPQRETIA